MIRLDQGNSLALQSVTLNAHKTGLGLLGSDEITAQDYIINARWDAIQAAGALCITAGSMIRLLSNEGSGILSAGLTLEDGGTLTPKPAQGADVTFAGDMPGVLAALSENLGLSDIKPNTGA